MNLTVRDSLNPWLPDFVNSMIKTHSIDDLKLSRKEKRNLVRYKKLKAMGIKIDRCVNDRFIISGYQIEKILYLIKQGALK